MQLVLIHASSRSNSYKTFVKHSASGERVAPLLLEPSSWSLAWCDSNLKASPCRRTTSRDKLDWNKNPILSLARFILGCLRLPSPPAGPRPPRPIQTPPPRGAAREHEAIMVRKMMSNHTCSNRPLPTCKTSIVVTAKLNNSFQKGELWHKYFLHPENS